MIERGDCCSISLPWRYDREETVCSSGVTDSVGLLCFSCWLSCYFGVIEGLRMPLPSTMEITRLLFYYIILFSFFSHFYKWSLKDFPCGVHLARCAHVTHLYHRTPVEGGRLPSDEISLAFCRRRWNYVSHHPRLSPCLSPLAASPGDWARLQRSQFSCHLALTNWFKAQKPAAGMFWKKRGIK